MANKLPYYKRFPKDFQADEKVRMMSLGGIGLYDCMLDNEWINGSVPSDPGDIAKAIGRDRREVLRYWPEVRACFVAHPSEASRLINTRLEEERDKANDKSTKCSGAARTRVRTLNGNSTDAGASVHADAVQQSEHDVAIRASDSESDSESEYSQRGSAEGEPPPMPFPNPIPHDIRVLQDRYHELVAAWPETDRRGVDLGAHRWIFLVDSGEIGTSSSGKTTSVEDVISGLSRWKLSELWMREGGKYIPAIATSDGRGWLDKRSWKDHPKPAKRQADQPQEDW